MDNELKGAMDQALSTTKMIAFALLFGVGVAFVGAAYYVTVIGDPLADWSSTVFLGLRGGVILFFFLEWYLGAFLVAQITDPDTLFEETEQTRANNLPAPVAKLMSSAIVGMALGEGIGFTALLISLLSGNPLDLIFTPILMLPFFWKHFPNRDDWAKAIQKAKIHSGRT